MSTMKHKLFPHTEDEKWAVLKSLECSEEQLKEDVNAIMDWFQKQPHLVEAGIDADVVRTFLLVTKGSREKAKQRIDNFYKYRGFAPELIQSRIQTLSSNQDLWTCYRQAAILKLYEGRRIIVMQILDLNASAFSAEQIFRNVYMMTDLKLKYDCFRGDIWVVDLKNATLGHLLQLNPLLVQKSAQIFQEGLGFKIHAIHVLNFPSFGQQIVKLFRKFIKAKIMDRVVIHANLEELHNVLPKQYLPKDYGGEDSSMEEYTNMYEEELQNKSTKQYLLNACKHVSNETKRPGINCSNDLNGSFKKLNID